MNEQTTRILLAEDNDGDIFLVRRALEKKGVVHELTVVRDGEEALKLLERTENDPKFGLILLDLNLPKVDGLKCCRISAKRTPSAVRR